jgi:cysteine-rich repeat protein
VGNENCEGNNISGDGCSSSCMIENGYTCILNKVNFNKTEHCNSTCGDGYVTMSEVCDQGAVSEPIKQACNQNNCLGINQYWKCNTTIFPNQCTPICNDIHLVSGIETCYDGNLNEYDGCSSSCQIETFFNCINYAPTSNCTFVCGDGRVMRNYNETCDTGSLNGVV